MTDSPAVVTSDHWRLAELIWFYHHTHHDIRRADVGIGLGSHDLGVASFTARLYHKGLFRHVLFTGGNSPPTVERFPRGEAVHFREHALEHGVPDSAILLETRSSNTGQNITFSREVLAGAGIHPSTILVVCKPYMERRAYATVRRLWPEVEVVCASEPVGIDEYRERVKDDKFLIDMLVGDLQRVIEYPVRGFAIPQDVPANVRLAYESLIAAGFDSRLLAQGPR